MITYMCDQGGSEWHDLRRGMLTASQVKLIMTPGGKVANNDKSRALAYELAAQRISGFVEESFVSDDMMRGHIDEVRARAAYEQHYAATSSAGLIVSDDLGFDFGYSPDGLVGDDGLIEVKSRRQKFQVQMVCDGVCLAEHILQVQSALLITGRDWCDYISYCGGLPMVVFRVLPDKAMHQAIIDAASAFEADVQRIVDQFGVGLTKLRHIQTERISEGEIQ